MILRKPYAVFIKKFRLLHIILVFLTAFLLYTSFTLYRFFDVYSIDYRAALVDYSTGKYINAISYIVIIVTLLLSVVLLSVMLYKNKPKRLYIFNVVLYIGIIVFYSICNSALSDINNVVMDVKASKALRDFALIATILQLGSVVLTFVRATGFDIKQFDFGTDLQKLDISEVDSEEIEVALAFDKDVTKRKIRYYLRNIKYVYFEHKFLINTVIASTLTIIVVFIYLNVRAYSVHVSEGKNFEVSNFTMNVQDSYILENDANGNALTETEGDLAGAIVAVRFQVKSYGIKQKLNTGLFTLRIGDLSYGQSQGIAAELYDIGTSYDNQELGEEFETYIMAFDVSKKQASKKMKLKINDDYSFVGGIEGTKSVYVSLNPADLRKEGQTFEKKIGESINFDDSVLGASSLKIDNFEINNSFKLSYNYCYGTNKCMDSNEVITPTATGNYFKTLMKISGNISIDKNINVDGVYDFKTFLNTFGTINYKINDNMVSKKIKSENIKPKAAKTDDYFIEVPLEAKDASEVYLLFKIRNQNYKYTLK